MGASLEQQVASVSMFFIRHLGWLVKLDQQEWALQLWSGSLSGFVSCAIASIPLDAVYILTNPFSDD